MDWRVIPGVMGRSALAHFSSAELQSATGLSGDLLCLWRLRGDLPAWSKSRACFDSMDLASISLRYELSKIGIAPAECSSLGDEISRLILYYALLSNDRAASVQGGLGRISQIAGQFHLDDEVARRISGTDAAWRYIWSPTPPTLELARDFGAILYAERFPAMIVLDLAVIGRNLALNSPKPLLMIDLSG